MEPALFNPSQQDLKIPKTFRKHVEKKKEKKRRGSKIPKQKKKLQRNTKESLKNLHLWQWSQVGGRLNSGSKLLYFILFLFFLPLTVQWKPVVVNTF